VYAEDYYGQSPMECPAGPEEGVMRSIRGGSIKSTAEECRIADRECADPEAKSPTMGFRIVRDELPTWPKYYRPIETEEAEE
jgi:formylglycine-generating enzyme required for sulfatase activity